MSTRTLHRVLGATATTFLIVAVASCGSGGSATSASSTASAPPTASSITTPAGPSSESSSPPSSAADDPLPTLGSTPTSVPQIGSYEGIDVGECFDFPTVAEADEVSCDEPHDAEMFVVDAAVGLTEDEAPYPTRQEWQDFSVALCDGPFADYTGQPIDESSGLSMSLIFPLESDWDQVSRRTLSCAIVSVDDSKLVGSKHA